MTLVDKLVYWELIKHKLVTNKLFKEKGIFCLKWYPTKLFYQVLANDLHKLKGKRK